MATRKKRSKAYRPREVRRDIAVLLFDGDRPLPESTRASILIALHSAIRSVATGTAIHDDWHTIVNALNTAQLICEGAGNKEVGMEVVYAAQNAMIGVAERCKNPDSPGFGRLGFGVGELPAVNDGAALYEQLLETITKRQYTHAIQEALRRLAAGAVVKVQRDGTPRFELAA